MLSNLCTRGLRIPLYASDLAEGTAMSLFLQSTHREHHQVVPTVVFSVKRFLQNALPHSCNQADAACGTIPNQRLLQMSLLGGTDTVRPKSEVRYSRTSRRRLLHTRKHTLHRRPAFNDVQDATRLPHTFAVPIHHSLCSRSLRHSTCRMSNVLL